MELPFYHDYEPLPSTGEDPRFKDIIISQNGIQIVYGDIYQHNITGDDYNVIVDSSIIWSTHLIFQSAVKLCKCTYIDRLLQKCLKMRIFKTAIYWLDL